jgi:hypothetical protein
LKQDRSVAAELQQVRLGLAIVKDAAWHRGECKTARQQRVEERGLPGMVAGEEQRILRRIEDGEGEGSA